MHLHGTNCHLYRVLRKSPKAQKLAAYSVQRFVAAPEKPLNRFATSFAAKITQELCAPKGSLVRRLLAKNI